MEFYDKYKHLKKAEKEFVWMHSIAALDFNANANTALQEAQKRFSSATLHNGSADAFRHCFWSAMNARDQGQGLAKMFGDAHEDFDENPPDEKIMDIHNNKVGYDIGGNTGSFSDRHLAVLCIQAWSARKLIIINAVNNGDLIYSNSIGKKLYGVEK